MKRFKKLMIVGMIALAALIGFQSSSNALTLGFYDFNTNASFFVEDGSLKDSNPTQGFVTYIGTVGLDWVVNITSTGLSIGTPSAPHIGFNVSYVSSAAGGGLAFGVFDRNFTGSSSSFDFRVGGTTQGTVSSYALGDTSNNESFIGTPIVVVGPFGPGAFSGTASELFGSDNPFSLGIVGIINHGSGVVLTNFEASLQQVPEPSVLLLMGFGLLGIWGLRRKFKK